MGKQTQRGDMTKVPQQISWGAGIQLRSVCTKCQLTHWWQPGLISKHTVDENNASDSRENQGIPTDTDLRNHMPSAQGRAQLWPVTVSIWDARKESRGSQGTWLFHSLGFLEIKIRVFLILETSGSPRAWPIARDTRYGTEKRTPTLGCFQSISSSGSFTHSDPVPPPLGISLLQEPPPTEGPACWRKGRHVCTRTLRSPSWHCSYQENNRGEMKINAQRYVIVLPKRELSAEESRRGGNT